MRVLVTGSSGFVGGHLVARLLDEGHTVEAWSRRGMPAAAGLHPRRLDLLDDVPLPAPPAGGWDAAFHLAGHSRPALLSSSEEVLENLRMAARVLDHVAETSPRCRFVLASSAHVYAPSAEPLAEDDALGPRSAYGLSKRLCEDWALARADALRLVIVRPFNQLGPGMPDGLLVPDLLARIRAGETTLHMRGSDDARDFLDIRDAVDAYLALLETDVESGTIFNLCSGRPTHVSELIATALARLGIERQVLFASPECDTVVGRPNRLQAAASWTPTRSLGETVASVIDGAS